MKYLELAIVAIFTVILLSGCSPDDYEPKYKFLHIEHVGEYKIIESDDLLLGKDYLVAKQNLDCKSQTCKCLIIGMTHYRVLHHIPVSMESVKFCGPDAIAYAQEDKDNYYFTTVQLASQSIVDTILTLPRNCGRFFSVPPVWDGIQIFLKDSIIILPPIGGGEASSIIRIHPEDSLEELLQVQRWDEGIANDFSEVYFFDYTKDKNPGRKEGTPACFSDIYFHEFNRDIHWLNNGLIIFDVEKGTDTRIHLPNTSILGPERESQNDPLYFLTYREGFTNICRTMDGSIIDTVYTPDDSLYIAYFSLYPKKNEINLLLVCKQNDNADRISVTIPYEK